MSDELGTLSVREAAGLLLITPRRLQQLVGEGWIAKPNRGRYPIASTIQGYARYLQDEARRTSKSAASSRVTDARTREIELRIAEREKRLIETDLALAVVDEIIGTYRAAYGGLAARVTRDIPLRRKIQAEIDATQNKIAALLEKRATDLEAGRDQNAEDEA